MSKKAIPTEEYERVDKSTRGRTIGSEDQPAVSIRVHNSDPYVYFGAYAYRQMGRPNYICFFKSGGCVLMEPHQEEGGLNPYKVGENHSASFGWYRDDVSGYAPVYYDDDEDLWWFDAEELVDDSEELHE